MPITLTIDPEKAVNGEFPRDLDRPGWIQGWGVIKGPPEDREFAGIYASQDDAKAAAAKAGPGFETRWGSYNTEAPDFVTGDTDNAVC